MFSLRFARILQLALLGGACLPAGLHAAGPAGSVEFFEAKIRPLLVDKCYTCHSAEAEKLKGGLRLDTRSLLLRGGESGPAIVPGDPEKSLLIKAVRYQDDHLQMPPKERLPESAIKDLAAWIAAGAIDPRTNDEPASATAQVATKSLDEYRQQWPYTALVAPPMSHVRGTNWVRTGIDQFVLAGLERAGVAATAPADRRTLLRRATYDLTGLPPTIEEVKLFLEDPAPDAFARVVERLLASPRYGERWARHWLDVVRYADSLDARGIGSAGDITEAYRYRDWVVNAFNRDLPYDQFVRMQIAGDLLYATNQNGTFSPDGIVATGVYAIGNWGNGDADKEKQLTDIVDDQVDLTGRAFLGLTVACARCHDHKFDPISTADYYGMAGFFFSSHILPEPGPKTAGSTILRIPLLSPTELAERKTREERTAQLEQSIKESNRRAQQRAVTDFFERAPAYLRAAVSTNLPINRAEKPLAPSLVRFARELFEPAKATLLTRVTQNLRGVAGLDGFNRPDPADTPSLLVNRGTSAVTLLTFTIPPRAVSLHPSPKAPVGVSWKSPVTGQVHVKGSVADADAKCGNGVTWRVMVRASGKDRTLGEGAIDNGGKASFGAGWDTEIVPGDEVLLEIGPRGDYSCDNTVVELEIAQAGSDHTWTLSRDWLAGGNQNPAPDAHGRAGVWSALDLDPARQTFTPPRGSLLETLVEAARPTAGGSSTTTNNPATSAAARFAQLPRANSNELSQAERELFTRLTVAEGPLQIAAAGATDAHLGDEAGEVTKAREELVRLKAAPMPAVPVAHGLQEGGCPKTEYAGFHDARIHIRGRYDRLGDTVRRRFPQLLAGEKPLAIAAGSGRAELARWITADSNPLTARVMVNRIWQQHFGEGLVRTANNFGHLGEKPADPALLDYLATQFIQSGWSIKAMHRLMMLSATYQQGSHPEAATAKADPENRLWSRMPRSRLTAEAIRDTLLSVAGRLDLTPGGPATRDIAMLRRTLYLMTVRSDRATYQMLFDAADANGMVDKRNESTVAPQALFLLNHPFAVEQAHALAERVAARGEASDEARVRWLYELLYSRPPRPAELEIAQRALQLSTGGTGATRWLPFCQVLLCANEFVYVD